MSARSSWTSCSTSGREVRVLDVLLHGQEDVAKDLDATAASS